MVGFSFVAMGQIPRAVRDETRLPWFTVLLWTKISRQPIPENKENLEDDIPVENDSQFPRFDSLNPATSRVFADGKFRIEVLCPPLNSEGSFVIEVKLGCQDVTGSQWELPVDKGSTKIPVRVQRVR